MTISVSNEPIPRYATADFQRTDPIPAEGRSRVDEIMCSGELFRYGNRDPQTSDAYLLEEDFKQYTEQPYALGVNSCSSAIGLALEAFNIKPGDKVFLPAFTFTAVPSAVVKLGAQPVLIECDRNYKIDLEHLWQVTAENPDAGVLLLSYMRGHIPNMDIVTDICEDRDLTLIEDCAHGLGSYWNKQKVGTFGQAACYSFQSYKIISAGEGGMVTTSSEEAFVRMVYMHGAYEELGRKHLVESPYFAQLANQLALDNFRMTNATAAMVRPQLQLLEERATLYRRNYHYLADLLAKGGPLFELPEDDPKEDRVMDSIQFRMPSFNEDQMREFVALVKKRGVPLAGFGAGGNARAPWNWDYLPDRQTLPQTREYLVNACDMRLVATLTSDMLEYIADAFLESAETVKKSA